MSGRRHSLRARIARHLEEGSESRFFLAASSIWGAIAARRLARPLELPPGVAVVAIGSAVLGGAGKTPLAIALAAALARSGERVGFVGHAYRATPEKPRFVDPSDAELVVGDDALAAARALVPVAVRVVVAPTRQAAVDRAAETGATVLVIDGLVQARPVRVRDSVLVLDTLAPWGSGACPPAGDLRAPASALLACADHVVALDGPSSTLPEGTLRIPSSTTTAVSPLVGAVPIGQLASLRVGLLLAIARPQRVEAALARVGVTPAVAIFLGDHDRPSPRDLERASRANVDVWLATERCVTKLPASLGGCPVLAIRHDLDVRPLVGRLRLRGNG